MATALPTDANGNPMQIAGLKDGKAHTLASYSTTAVRNATAFETSTRAIFIYATTNCRIKQGDVSVTAVDDNTSHFIPANTYLSIDTGAPDGSKISLRRYLSVVGVGGNSGTLYVSEIE